MTHVQQLLRQGRGQAPLAELQGFEVREAGEAAQIADSLRGKGQALQGRRQLAQVVRRQHDVIPGVHLQGAQVPAALDRVAQPADQGCH